MILSKLCKTWFLENKSAHHSKPTTKTAERCQLTCGKALFHSTPLILIKCCKDISRRMSITRDFLYTTKKVLLSGLGAKYYVISVF